MMKDVMRTFAVLENGTATEATDLWAPVGQPERTVVEALVLQVVPMKYHLVQPSVTNRRRQHDAREEMSYAR